ncbi:endonuclease [Thorsellia kenyensis]|uniref:Endonuclease n=1 Tax=Thorsellia kenyensis TaxID=1549888 RepID=A0ABV6C8S3_9GAMM
MKKYHNWLILLILISVNHTAFSAQPKNFSQAKKIAPSIYKDHPYTFYCDCPITWQNKKGIVEIDKCDYKIRKNQTRAERVEWEHVVPASKFTLLSENAEQRACWQDGGRKNCSQKDPLFQKMEGDLHNLQPAIGEINGDRGNLSFSHWEGHTGHSYGRCSIKIDFKRDEVDPPDSVKGQIARIYLYMYETYGLSYSLAELIQMDYWNSFYPVTKWECERDRRIAKIQGNHNKFVKENCDRIE